MKVKLIVVGLLTFGLMSCDSEVEDVESERASSNVATTDTDGKVVGTASKDSDSKLVASPDSELADSSIEIPTGALALDTELMMAEATEVSDTVLGALSVHDSVANPAVVKRPPLFAAPTKGKNVDLAKPMTLALPLPMSEASLTLADAPKLGFVYVIYVDGGYKAGIKALTAANLSGLFATAEFEGLGYFQLVLFTKAIVDEEISYSTAPKVK